MSLRGNVTWAGLTLGTGTPFGITSVDGWEDLPPTVDGSEAYGFDHGEQLGPLSAPGRTVTVEGFVYDRDATEGLVLAFQDATPLNQSLDVLTVDQFSRPLTAQARLLRRSLPQVRGYGSGWQTWALQWRAPDPRRYGLSAGDVAVGLPTASGGIALPAALPTALGTQTSTGRVYVPNDGRASYRPVLAVTGPAPNGFELLHLETGRRLRYTGVLTGSSPGVAADVLTLDNRRRRVRLAGGTDRRGNLTVAQWFEVPPGGATFAWASLGTDYDPAANLRVLTPPSGAHW